MMNVSKTKNDIAWEQLFADYSILEQVKKNGHFVINSTQINVIRESRLMAKFDQLINLPQIFSDNSLSILPVSRSEYIIGTFNAHRKVEYDKSVRPEPISFPPDIQSIDPYDIYSEAIALNYVFNADIINELVDEKTFHTVSGRMSTAKFNFSIANSSLSSQPYRIDVENSQCEIDGGYEGEHSFVLVEAKNYAVEDFLVRQLYYPYRLWSSKLTKRVIPVLMTFSQDIFDFFIYEFINDIEYSSLQLVKQKRFALAPEPITTNDISTVLTRTRIVSEPRGASLPQADSFDKIMDFLSLLTNNRTLTKDEMTARYQFDVRQTQYYASAGRYLGLIDSFTDVNTGDVTYKLTNEAELIFRQRHKQKHLGIIRKIFEHVVYNEVFQLALQLGNVPSNEEISQIIIRKGINISGTTVPRRASTVRGWTEWIWKQI